jgi:oligopeptide/dipeptide ABC transporter ATP-binding protein
MVDHLLDAQDLERAYSGPRRSVTVAVDGVSIRLGRGSSYGLVGESGSGKSTLARLLLALERPDAGTVVFDGHPISELSASRVRPLRRRFQAVFQDPIGSLNPRLTVATIVAEPLVAHRIGTHHDRRDRVHELLDSVGLPADSARRYPGAFSGGERQRIAIARAIAPEPELLILDEPVSSLDATAQTRILDLLNSLRQRLALALVLISHDLRVVHQVTERVGVMYRGAVVEEGPSDAVFSHPAHPYTRALLAAAPRPTPEWRPVSRPVPEQRSWPTGACRYTGRCPLATTRCADAPTMETVAPDHTAACWHADCRAQ